MHSESDLEIQQGLLAEPWNLVFGASQGRLNLSASLLFTTSRSVIFSMIIPFAILQKPSSVLQKVRCKNTARMKGCVRSSKGSFFAKRLQKIFKKYRFDALIGVRVGLGLGASWGCLVCILGVNPGCFVLCFMFCV